MSIDDLFSQDEPAVPIRGIHFDLKGCPPTPERLLSLLGVLAKLRINAVLVEWEDAFPWTVDRRFQSETAYTPEQVTAFTAEAARLGIEIIPLVQCLGHMETPLNVSGYESMREVAHQSMCLNPLAPGARELIERMVDDVLALCPDVRHFHLGGDEAWTFGSHPDTEAFIEKHGKGALYLHHVEPILDKLNARGITPMLWHDMMREWDDDALDRLSGKAELMCWGYNYPEQLGDLITPDILERFKAQGIRMWAGTAYKGAHGHSADRPDHDMHAANALWWTQQAQQFDMVGTVATAWSRYSTHRMQCETIEASLESLVHVARILHDGQRFDDADPPVRDALADLGELEHAQRCAAAADRIAEVRCAGWLAVQSLREFIVTTTLDARRRTSGTLIILHRELGRIVDQADAAAREFAAAHDGRMGALWVERYLAERIEPLREEYAALTPRVRQLDPVGDAAGG